MLFFAPLAYIGISYYQGEDGLQNVKDIVTNLSSSEKATEVEVKADAEPSKTITLDDQIQILRQRIEQLEKENQELKQALEDRGQ